MPEVYLRCPCRFPSSFSTAFAIAARSLGVKLFRNSFSAYSPRRIDSISMMRQSISFHSSNSTAASFAVSETLGCCSYRFRWAAEARSPGLTEQMLRYRRSRYRSVTSIFRWNAFKLHGEFSSVAISKSSSRCARSSSGRRPISGQAGCLCMGNEFLPRRLFLGVQFASPKTSAES